MAGILGVCGLVMAVNGGGGAGISGCDGEVG